MARQVGAKTQLVNRVGFGNTEMTETIESKNLSEEITFLHEAKRAWNRVVYRFVEIDPTPTRWVFESERVPVYGDAKNTKRAHAGDVPKSFVEGDEQLQ